MKKHNTLSVLVMIFLTVGCASPVRQTQPTVQAYTTASSTLTAIPLPTLTLTYTPIPTTTAAQTHEPAILTPTTEPALRTNGPYFTYFRQVPGFDTFQFVLMDADGGGRRVIDLPDEIADSFAKANYFLDGRYVSPDGKWMAFYTGSAGKNKGELMVPGTYDLTLNLLDLTTGEKQIIISLLSEDYPNNFIESIKEINESLFSPKELQFTFLETIAQVLAWSPDGRYLAFAGQMDGLSSDLYLYDMTTKKTQRLSSEPEELLWIRWSPDGKWILYRSGVSIEQWFENHLYVAAVDNPSIQNMGYGVTSDWLNSHQFLEYRSGIETFQLQLVDVATGKFTDIWQGYFNDYKMDPTGNWIAVYAISSALPPESDKPGFVPGIQLINLKSFKTIQNAVQLSEPLDMFVRTQDGTVIDLPYSAAFGSKIVVASPDSKYWAVSSDQAFIAADQRIEIYSQDLTLIQEILIPVHGIRLRDVQWRPDSSGLFLLYGNLIYSVNLSNGDLDLVEENLTEDYCSACRWILGQSYATGSP